MNDMCDLEPSHADITDAAHLIIKIITTDCLFSAHMREHAALLPLTYIERLTVSRIDESINVNLELVGYTQWGALVVG